MKLIHTGDIHLDTCYTQVGLPARFGNRRRQSLRDVFAAIMRRAAEWPADAVLIAGDLFELEYVTRDTLAFLRAQFETLRPIPVLIAPGNHDPALPNSPYITETWPDNVRIFDKPQWRPHALLDGRLIIHGFGFDAYEPIENPWGQLALESNGAIHVALGHGSERGHQPPDAKTYCPFDAAAAAAPGLAYVALGHFHAPIEIPGLPVPVHYCGAPEGHDFSETGPRYYLEIEISDTDARVQRVCSSRVLFTRHEISLGQCQSAQDLIDALRAIAAAADRPQIARVTLTGTAPAALTVELEAVRDAVAGDFEYLELVDETEPEEDFEQMAHLPTTLGLFVRQINQEIADAPNVVRRDMLRRARQVGIAAYQGQKLAINGADGEAAS